MSHSEKPLHIDIPVELAEVKTVFSIGALAFEGDLPVSIFHMQLIENDASDVVAIFHTNAGHAILHDAAYNVDRSREARQRSTCELLLSNGRSKYG